MLLRQNTRKSDKLTLDPYTFAVTRQKEQV